MSEFKGCYKRLKGYEQMVCGWSLNGEIIYCEECKNKLAGDKLNGI